MSLAFCVRVYTVLWLQRVNNGTHYTNCQGCFSSRIYSIATLDEDSLHGFLLCVHIEGLIHR
jgi:hypothetical protein